MLFINIFNAIANVVKNNKEDEIYAKSIEDTWEQIGLDSLDTIMVFVYMSDVYGIEDCIMKEWVPKNIHEFHDLLMANKTKEPQSVEEAMSGVK
jgi:hypothetical protein